MEMSIVDDASSRPPDDVIPARAPGDIRVIRLEKNAGPGRARNVGIGAARGELIAFLDSDDVWMADKTECQVRMLRDHPRAAWVYSDCRYIWHGAVVSKPNSRFHGFPHGMPAERLVNEYHLRGYNYITMSSVMTWKWALDEIDGFDETLRISEDWDLFSRMAERFDVRACPQPLQLYRLKGDGAWHYAFVDEYAEVNARILTRLYERQGLLPARARDLARGIAMVHERAAIQRLNAGQVREARRHLFHPAIRPKRFHVRLIALRLLALLPPLCYRLALKLYFRLQKI